MEASLGEAIERLNLDRGDPAARSTRHETYLNVGS
jgi:hypothetical protein